MNIREITASELEELLSLYEHLHTSDDPLPDRTVVGELWRDIQKNPLLKYFGGFIDDRLISTCTLTIIPNLTRGCRPYGVIENVVTHSDFRGKGHGRSVLNHALSYAWSQHCYKVMLMTGRKGEGTYRFYESAGFDRHAKQAFLAKPAKPNKLTAPDVAKPRARAGEHHVRQDERNSGCPRRPDGRRSLTRTRQFTTRTRSRRILSKR